VFIPDWSDGRSYGLSGRIRDGGRTIVWTNGDYWSRVPDRPPWPR